MRFPHGWCAAQPDRGSRDSGEGPGTASVRWIPHDDRRRSDLNRRRPRNAVGLLPVLLALMLVGAACGAPAPPPLGFEPPTLPDAQVGIAYDARITVTGNVTPVGAFSISNGALPAGLSIEKLAGEDAAGHIVGTPTAAGAVNFTVSVWCYGTNSPGQTGLQDYTITVR